MHDGGELTGRSESGWDGPRVLFESDLVVVGEFRCPPDSPRWREVNSIGAGHHVVFPAAPVRIAQGGRPGFVADRNHVVLYNPEEEYRRALVSPVGDACCYLIVRPDIIEHAMHGAVFPTDHGALRPASFFLHRRLHQLARRHASDALQLEELSIAVIDQALRDALSEGIAATPATPDRPPAEDVKTLLSTRFAEPLTLSAIGAEVGYSPYHLARSFRRQTGTSIHAYRRQLRVRYALDQLLDSCDGIAEVAARAGFASHSHLTDTFRATFGFAPSRARQLLLAG